MGFFCSWPSFSTVTREKDHFTHLFFFLDPVKYNPNNVCFFAESRHWARRGTNSTFADAARPQKRRFYKLYVSVILSYGEYTQKQLIFFLEYISHLLWTRQGVACALIFLSGSAALIQAKQGVASCLLRPTSTPAPFHPSFSLLPSVLLSLSFPSSCYTPGVVSWA